MNGQNQSSNGSGPAPLTCDSPPLTENVIMTVYLVVILVLTVAGNLLVISVVIAYQRLQQVTNYFIVSLAVSDLLIAALTLPLTINATIHNEIWCLNLSTCGVWLVVDALVSCASICNLAAISIDRLIAITSPFRYREIVTRNRAFIVLGVIWAYALVWGCLALLNWQDTDKPGIAYTLNGQPATCQRTEPIYYTVAAAMSFFVPLLIVLTAYSIILKVAITQAKAVAALDLNRDRRKKTNFFREVKATKTVALVIGAFVISWLPVFILLMLALWDQEGVKKFDQKHPKIRKGIFFTFLRVLPPLNACINPIIYAVFNSHFRSAFLKFLRCPQRTQNDDTHSMHTTHTTTQRTSYSTMVPEKSETGNNNTDG
ncbi:alpha-1A adrenergic receptor-like [Dendronephthya gigantea]|uniref:alpha-1A adrenergic receptor-like n=1 Tax=Dendronephthya gigantea TaxID=151771 RepID=UPI00106B3DD6|nr:alpha-1A adrenergic receptor-like [Dendronephthya gigantea]XP_028391817.1 alpha-1A adrenergic receptor-like [Dendronephthya gigantea]